MASNLMVIGPALVRDDSVDADAGSAARAELSAAVAAAFGVEFSLLDGDTGEVLQVAADHAGLDWTLRAELCRAVSRGRVAELIEDEDPLLSLAIPLMTAGSRPLVAVGLFLARPLEPGESTDDLQSLLGISGWLLAGWVSRQSPWSPNALLRMSQLLMEKLAAERRAQRLDHEVNGLSFNLATTYEEISLLHRLTQNLRLSSKDEELGHRALGWLSEIMPVESLAIQLVPLLGTTAVTPGASTEPRLLTHGPCPVDSAEFSALVEHFASDASQRPRVVNWSTTDAPDWPFLGIRQLIAVPLAEGGKVFGWLAAFNHVHGHELGTVEASLLTSVAAILGIHSGNAELYREQADFFAGVVRALTSAIDAKDPYTCGHSNRVARVSVWLAQEMGLHPDQVNTIYLSGLLHDIGKIGIDDTVLRKPGALTPEEYEHIKTHAEIGYRILAGLKQLDDVLPVVLHHHEQWNGQGYPHKLAGEAIPLMARICAVADGFDAMGSDRPYRKGMPEPQLDAILRAGAGKQWDAQVIDAFFRARDDIREISRRERENLALDVKQWS
jgi:HD-GYP domain-containing protein (c-di-GMP phosphodiesterase class II)